MRGKTQDNLSNNLRTIVHIRVTNSIIWQSSCVLWLLSTASTLLYCARTTQLLVTALTHIKSTRDGESLPWQHRKKRREIRNWVRLVRGIKIHPDWLYKTHENIKPRYFCVQLEVSAIINVLNSHCPSNPCPGFQAIIIMFLFS